MRKGSGKVLCLLGLVVFTGGTMASSVRTDEPVKALGEVQRGMTLGFYAPAGYYGSQEARDEVDRIAAMGATWILLAPNVWQEGRYTTVQFNDFMKSQSDLDILDLCDYIHAKGLHVTLRPMLECFDGTDRMYIDFENDVYRLNPRHGSAGNTYCSRWFASMKARTVHYAAVAERCRCEAFCIDSELDRMADYAFNAYWKDILSDVRKVYTGAVTSCHTRNPRHGVKWDECLSHRDFWLYDLDYLQISDYRRPVKDYAERPHTVEEMVEGFERDWLPFFRDLAKRYGKPIQVGEFGCPSVKAGARSPAGSPDIGYDGEEQARFVEAFFRVFWKEPWCTGFYWWKWDSHPEWYVPDGTTRIRKGDTFIDVAHSDPAQQRKALADLRRRGILKSDEDPLKPTFKPPPRGDHAVSGKPAEGVMRAWYSKADHADALRPATARSVSPRRAAPPIGRETALNGIHHGMSIGLRVPFGYFSSSEARRDIDAMAEMGVDWVVLCVTVWQEGRYSPLQFADFGRTPGEIEILDLCDYIHSKGLHVTLRPMEEAYDGTDRMYLDFENDVFRCPPIAGSVGNTYCSRWFRSVKARSVWYARVAERCRCEAFCIDSEMDRMADYAFNAYWKDILAEVRKVYTGALTSCHTRNPRHGVKWDACLSHKDFWLYDLDYLQISDYRRPVKDYAERPHTVEEMVEGFERDWLPFFRDLAKRYGKPLQFGEFGCTSSRAGARSPASPSNLGYDGVEQANFLEAFMRVFAKEPWCCGYYWWSWTRPFSEDERQQRETEGPDSGFCPYGKPVADVFRKWYGGFGSQK